MTLGRQVAWEIYKFFRLQDAAGSIVDFEDLHSLQLVGGKLRAFDIKWDQKMLAMEQCWRMWKKRSLVRMTSHTDNCEKPSRLSHCLRKSQIS